MVEFKDYSHRNKPKEELIWTEVNPNAKYFFDNILNYISDDEDVIAVQKAIKYFINADKLCSFYVPEFYFVALIEGHRRFMNRYDNLLSFECDNAIHFSSSKHLLKKLKKTWKIRKLKIGNPSQYYLFLVSVVNRLINEGYDISSAIDKIIKNRCECDQACYSFLCKTSGDRKSTRLNSSHTDISRMCGQGIYYDNHFLTYKPLATLELYGTDGIVTKGDVLLFVIQ